MDRIETPAHPPVAGSVLWFALFGGVAAWVVHLGASYLLVPVACRAGAPAILHALTVAMGLIATSAVAAGWRSARRLAADPAWHRPAFMARLGILVSGFFLMVILAEGVPRVLQDPCARIHPGAPVVWLFGPSAALAHVLEDVPLPGTLFSAFRPDGWVLFGLTLAALVHAIGLRRLWRAAGMGHGVRAWEAAAYFAGLLAVALAVASPLDALSSALFSAHMVQHLLLTLVAAPLLVLGRPGVVLPWALPEGGRRILAAGWSSRRLGAGLRGVSGTLRRPSAVFVLYATALWSWHHPRLYQAALFDPLVHALEHACFLLTAILWWSLVIAAGRGGRLDAGAAILLVFVTMMQKAFLGVILTLSPSAWYPAHAAGAEAWGTTLLGDQQLAGLLMWVPGKPVYVLLVLWLLRGWLQAAGRRAWSPETTI
jgi:putative membrane protein